MKFSACLLPFLFLLTACTNSSPGKVEPVPEAPLYEMVEYVYYISSRGQGFDIYRKGIGKEEEQITSAPGWEWGPQPIRSKDMLWYYSQDTTGKFLVRSMDTEGEMLPDTLPDLPNLVVDPTGEKVVWQRRSGDNSFLVLAKIEDLSDSLVFTLQEGYHGRPKWDANGERIVYLSDQDGKNELYLYDLEREETVVLTDNDLREKYVAWDPMGHRIATTMSQDTLPNDIFLVDVNTFEVEQLTDSPINEIEIAWSASGEFLAYHAEVDSTDDIYIIEMATGEVTKLTNGEGYHGEPAWYARKEEIPAKEEK